MFVLIDKTQIDTFLVTWEFGNEARVSSLLDRVLQYGILLPRFFALPNARKIGMLVAPQLLQFSFFSFDCIVCECHEC